MKNQEIAEILNHLADMLELKRELGFKVNAYRKASRVITDLQEDIAVYWQEKRLKSLPGVGDAMAKKIDEYLTTGKMKKYEEVKAEVPEELVQLLQIQNLGPRTLALAYQKFGVQNLADLNAVIEDGRLAELSGMGPKKIENIKKGIALFQSAAARISIGTARPIIDEIIAALRQSAKFEKITPAGSARRGKETVGDIDLLVATKHGPELVQTFVNLSQVERVLAAGETKGSILVRDGLQVDLRAVEPEAYGAALQYFTGSQAHNVKLRGIARKRDFKINEYGIFRGEKRVGGTTEAEIYENLGLEWIPPELREDRGEIEAAAENRLPPLVELKQIRGDLHLHSKYSDGLVSMEEMVQAAQETGYDYLAFCEHSQSAYYANGLTETRIRQQIEEIQQLNEKFSDFQILTGTEVDILPDGQLDFPDEILAQLDIVVASIHSAFKQNVTERILVALKNPHVDIIAHPTGRLISRREGYAVDLPEIFEVAAQTGTALEINAYPDRLDLSDVNARRAIDAGVILAINTDAHEPVHLSDMKFGVATARRGWCTAENILNTKSFEELKQWKRSRKQS